MRLLLAGARSALRDELEGLSRAQGADPFCAQEIPAPEDVEAWDACLVLPGPGSARLAGLARSRHAGPVVLVVGGADRDGTAEKEAADQASAHGFDVLCTPPDALAFRMLLARLRWRSGDLARRERRRRRTLLGDEDLLLGDSPACRRLVEEIGRVAGTPRTTVVVRGPRGAEKERVARLIHARSARARGSFVSVDCAASEEARIETEVFGDGRRSGALQWADGGTLFLADIASLPDRSQERLLLYLEEERLDGEPLDARVIVASNHDLDELVGRGLFREDLAYRLNVLAVRVPSLSRRRPDIVPIARRVLARASLALGRRVEGLSREGEAAIEAHHWPGEMRELRAALELAVLVGSDELVGPADLRLAPIAGDDPAGENVVEILPAEAAAPARGRTLRAAEEALIRRVLAEEKGNRSRAARVLGIHRATLYNKLREYGIA